MRKVDENKLDKQNRLLETAFSLFTTKGIVKTSISDIVEDAGVAKGTFYLYFRDKYDLANKLIIHKARTLFMDTYHNLEESGCRTPEDKIIFIVDHILDKLQKNHQLLRFIDKNLSWGIFRNALESAEADARIRDEIIRNILGPDMTIWTNPMALIYIIIELVGSSSYSVILEKDPMTIEEFKPFLFQSIRSIMEGFRRK